MTYRKKFTLAFIAYSLFLTLIYSILILGTLYTTEDQLYQHLLEQYYTKLSEQYDKGNQSIGFQEPLISQKIYRKEAIPKHLRNLPAGIAELEEDHILVKPLKGDQVLFLTLPEVDGLNDKFESFVLILLFIFSLIIILCGAALAFILARQLSTPIENLVKDVKQASLDTDNICKEGNYYELNMLARSFNEAMLHIKTTLKREKSFTQSVSHELRTPLMVMKSNLDILKAHKEPLTIITRSTDRMLRATNSMSNLTNVFLILARHDKFSIEKESFNPAHIIQSFIDASDNQSINWNVDCQPNTTISSPVDLFNILLSNIIDNANKYAEESATMVITNDHLETYNKIRIGTENSGSSHLGINIIERICYALDWRMMHKIEHSVFFLRIDFQKTLET